VTSGTREIRNFATDSSSSSADAVRKTTRINERLVTFLVQRARVPSSDHLQVRMIVDNSLRENHEQTVQVVSLTQAIQTSIAAKKDLIEVALENQEIPVVKVADYKSILYKSAKKVNKSIKKQSLPDKEIRVRAKIAENDLKRKTETIISYLEKGHKCVISVRCRQRDLEGNPNTAIATIDRVLDQVKHVGGPVKAPTINEEKTGAQVMLQKKGSSSSIS
jgi:translation initiation factor IF-3